MDNLKLFGEILDKSEWEEDFKEELSTLLGGHIENYKNTLSLKNVMDISNILIFKIFVVENRDIDIDEYINLNPVDTNQNFHEFIRSIVKKDDVIRIDEVLTSKNSYSGKRVSIVYTPLK